MKKKIATLLLTVAMAGALLAGPALARDRDNDDYNHGRWNGGNEWREHHPYQGYGDSRWGYGYGNPHYGYGGHPQGWNSGWAWHHDDDDRGWFNHGGRFHHGDDD
jgi:hypothetical protein